MANDRGVTPQGEDFSSWYNELIARAELADHGPVRGTMVIRPYGYAIWELIQRELDDRIKATGHENAYFPLFIPEEYFRREAEHVDGFAPELAVVTHAGGSELNEPLVVRPTSETIIGEYFAKWISSYRDLPLLLNQWANVVRWELRPRLFLRTTEFLWQEGHTAHASADEAIAETELAASFYRDVAESVAALPVLVGDKTPSERFAGAQRTISLEAMMRDGRALQSGTSHFLGTNFAEAFDITYTSQAGILEHAWTSSWGMSSRLIGGVIMAHGDDKGLILPPRLAPIEVVIVPIGRGEDLDAVLTAARELAGAIRSTGTRVKIDERDQLSPGRKFNEWELKGVPIRIEIGPRDLADGVATIADRLSGSKDQAPLSEIAEGIRARLVAFQQALFDRALAFRIERTRTVLDWDDLADAVASGFALMFHCGTAVCEDRIKKELSATPRVIPDDEPIAAGTCAACGEPSGYDRRVIFARAY